MFFSMDLNAVGKLAKNGASVLPRSLDLGSQMGSWACLSTHRLQKRMHSQFTAPGGELFQEDWITGGDTTRCLAVQVSPGRG